MSIILISVFFFFWINRNKNIKKVMKWCSWHPKDCYGIHQGYTTAVLIPLYSRVCFHSVSTQYMSVPESRKGTSVPKTFFMLQWQLLFCITCTIDCTWFSGPKSQLDKDWRQDAKKVCTSQECSFICLYSNNTYWEHMFSKQRS